MRSGGLLALTGVLTIGALAITVALGGSTQAAPLELKQVAADAKWLAHLDVDALRQSTVVQHAWQAALARHPDAEAKLAFVRGVLGMDLTKDIHGLTCYGQHLGKPQGVLIIAGQFDPNHLAALATLLPGSTRSDYRDYHLASWTCECHGHSQPAAAVLRSKDQLVIAGSVADLQAALDVLDGKAAGLTGESSLAGNIPPGTSFVLRVQGIKDADFPCHIPVLKHLESLRLVSGEHEGKSFVRSRYVMTDPATVALALEVVEGRKAEAELLLPDELGRKLVAALRPKVDGSTITLLWSAPADEVWEELQKIEKMIAKHRARHKEHHGQQGCGCPLCKMRGTECDKCPLCAGGKSSGKPAEATKKSVPPEEDF